MHGAGVCSGGEFGGSQDEKKKRKRPPPPAGGSMSKGPKKSCSFSSSSPRKKKIFKHFEGPCPKEWNNRRVPLVSCQPVNHLSPFLYVFQQVGGLESGHQWKDHFFFLNLIKWPRESIVGDPCNLGLLKNVNVLNNVCQLCRVNNGHLGPTMALLAFFGG